jgi:hypothetical protein
MRKELDEAAHKQFLKIASQLPGRGFEHIAEESFLVGADWAMKNSPEVLALVEALEIFIEHYFVKESDSEESKNLLEALSKWRGGE